MNELQFIEKTNKKLAKKISKAETSMRNDNSLEIKSRLKPQFIKKNL